MRTLLLLIAITCTSACTEDDAPTELPTCAEAGCPDAAFCTSDPSRPCTCIPEEGADPIQCTAGEEVSP